MGILAEMDLEVSRGFKSCGCSALTPASVREGGLAVGRTGDSLLLSLVASGGCKCRDFPLQPSPPHPFMQMNGTIG